MNFKYTLCIKRKIIIVLNLLKILNFVKKKKQIFTSIKANVLFIFFFFKYIQDNFFGAYRVKLLSRVLPTVALRYICIYLCTLIQSWWRAKKLTRPNSRRIIIVRYFALLHIVTPVTIVFSIATRCYIVFIHTHTHIYIYTEINKVLAYTN